MIIPLDIQFHGIFNGVGYLILGGIRVDLLECEDGRFGVDEAVLTNISFQQSISANKDLYSVLIPAYTALSITNDRVERKDDGFVSHPPPEE